MEREIKEYLTKKLWLEAQYGIVTEVATACGVSRQFVHLVFWGKKTSARVKQALINRGAPIADRRGDQRRAEHARRRKATA